MQSPPWISQKKETASFLGGFLLVFCYFFLIYFPNSPVAVQMSHRVHEPNNHVHKDGNKGGEQEVVQDFL